MLGRADGVSWTGRSGSSRSLHTNMAMLLAVPGLDFTSLLLYTLFLGSDHAVRSCGARIRSEEELRYGEGGRKVVEPEAWPRGRPCSHLAGSNSGAAGDVECLGDGSGIEWQR